MTLHQRTGSLFPKPPFDFTKSITFLHTFTPMVGEQELGDNVLTKAISVKGQAVVFQVRSAGSVETPRLDYTLFSKQPLSEEETQAVATRIAFFLSIDDDLRCFYQIASNDAPFAPFVQKLYGLHHVKFLTLFESGCWAAICQHIPLAMARGMKRKLVEKYGCSLVVDGKQHWAFPEWDRLANVSAEEFQTFIRNERRSEYLCNVIAAFGKVDERWLCTAPYVEAEAWLRRIKGIGEWSAAFILLRGLGRMESLPLTLKPLLAATAEVYGEGTPAFMQELADRYGDWHGYWAYYLRVAS